MSKGRLEAFTDGVIAIIITIMVLEINVPRGADLTSLQADLPILLTYKLSYLNVGRVTACAPALNDGGFLQI
jgi:uncharacterized membrane protein